MLQQYKNKDKFIIGPNTARRFSTNTENLLQKTIVTTEFTEPSVELHIYSGDTWISGNHYATVIQQTEKFSQKIIKHNQQIEFNGSPIILDVFSEFKSLGIPVGNFSFVVNFFKNCIGSYDNQYLYIDEISPDRTEIRLKLIPNVSSAGKRQFIDYTKLNKERPQTSRQYYTQYLLNFSRNKTIPYINSVVIGDLLYVKLIDPLPDDLEVQFKCWIVEEKRLPHVDFISLYPKDIQRTVKQLANANFEVSVDGQNPNSGTNLKSFNELLGSSVSTSQQILDRYFSGSLEGVPLNIDYRDFNNFVFYSSAEQRVYNFKYKLELLEYYNSQITVLQSVSGSAATTNISDYATLKTSVVSEFDAFERYLYYESSSILTTHDIPVLNANVSALTGSYVFPAPKSNTSKPYSLYPTTSSMFVNWYDTLISSASYYDSLNLNRLIYSLPDASRNIDEDNQLTLFVDMLGHHYDIIHSYVKQASLIYKSEENPKIGVPNDLLLYVAKQFGWNLQEGNQYQDLWQYSLGTNEYGTPLTGSNTVGDPSVPGKEMTSHVWRRIVNNLPYILKSKGTKRSVKALLACYGIPESIITINEYGGPRTNRIPVYEKLNFDYALDLINNSSGTVKINYDQPIGAYEMRFRTANVVTNPTIPSTMNLATIGSNVITLNFSSGNKGNISINGSSTGNIELYDGGWLSLLVQQSGSKLDLLVKKSKYGKIVATVSSSVVGSFTSPDSIILGDTTSGSRLVGQLQEVRLYSGSLSVSAFENHTKAPAAYDTDTSTYDELLFRLPLTQKIDHSLTGSLVGVQPISSSVSASFSVWTTLEPYDSIEETYYYDGISVAVGTNDDNKIRIEQNDLIENTLYINQRAETSQYDLAPLDSNRIGVYFSPQTMINEDIIAHLGYTEIDQYIGDPGDAGRTEYPLLKQVASAYWKKYLDKNDMNSYIRIFTLFDLSFFQQLKQLLPARAEKLTGILIQPNVLERNKQATMPIISRTFNYYEVDTYATASATSEYLVLSASMRVPDEPLNGDYLTLSASIDSPDNTINSDYLSKLVANVSLNQYVVTGSADDIPETLIDVTSINYISGSVITLFGGVNINYIQFSNNGFDSTLNFYLTQSSDQRYKSSNYSYNYLIKSGSTYITGSSPYWKNEPFVAAITSSVYSEFLKKIETFISGGIKYTISSSKSNVSDFKPTGMANAKYNGSKMSSPGFNQPSPDTYQGKPVVEIIIVNPNQVVFNNTTTTNPTGT